MLILRLWNYIRGYVIIFVEGFFPEKFINICINRGIFLWDINREKSCAITLKVGIKAFKKLKPIVRKTRCRLQIKAKKGLPFLFYRYRKRKTFLAGCLIFIGMVCFLSSFIWDIEVYGNKMIPAQDIIDQLSSTGLKAGCWKPMVDADRISNQMMIQMQELAWINIDISGTRAIVEVAERVMPPEIIAQDIPCNIVAAKDGVITSIFVREGSPVVQVGSSVKKGDLLVAGMVESKDRVVRYVHAMADISARTWYEEAVNIQTSRIQLRKSGIINEKYSIRLFNKIIGFGDSRPPFEYYDLEKVVRQVSLGRDNQLPFGIIINKYIEKKQVKENISLDKAKEEATNAVWEKVKSKLPENSNITDRKLYLAPGKNSVRARMLVECSEDIGLQERITY